MTNIMKSIREWAKTSWAFDDTGAYFNMLDATITFTKHSAMIAFDSQNYCLLDDSSKVEKSSDSDHVIIHCSDSDTTIRFNSIGFEIEKNNKYTTKTVMKYSSAQNDMCGDGYLSIDGQSVDHFNVDPLKRGFWIEATVLHQFLTVFLWSKYGVNSELWAQNSQCESSVKLNIIKTYSGAGSIRFYYAGEMFACGIGMLDYKNCRFKISPHMIKMSPKENDWNIKTKGRYLKSIGVKPNGQYMMFGMGLGYSIKFKQLIGEYVFDTHQQQKRIEELFG